LEPIDRYDKLLQIYSELNGLKWKWMKNQMIAESSGNPDAITHVGAKGLFQFMDATWQEWGEGNVFEPEANIKAACRYVAYLYSKFAEIPDETERLIFAMASFNAGKDNINQMLSKARYADGKPGSYAQWEKAGKPEGVWQTWDYARRFLVDITGKHSKETIQYIERIFS
jgi:membrane-bound lytic murein transglycosylase F